MLRSRTGNQLTPAELKAASLSRGVTLSDADAQLLAQMGWGAIDPATAKLGDGTRTLVTQLLRIDLPPVSMLMTGLPFAKDAGGNLFLISVDGSVVFWDHETDDFESCAPTLQAFVLALEPAPSENEVEDLIRNATLVEVRRRAAGMAGIGRFACKHRRRDVLEWVINTNGDTDGALHSCSQNGFDEGAALLLAAGRPANERNLQGRTPLMDALLFARENVVELLLSAGSDVRARDHTGRSVADYARANPRLPADVRTRVLTLVDS